MSTAERTVTNPPALEAEPLREPSSVGAARGSRRRDRVVLALGADLVAVVVAWVSALALTANFFTDQRAEIGRLTLGIAVLSGIWLGLLAIFGSYHRRRVSISSRGLDDHLKSIALPLIVGGLGVLLMQAPLTEAFGPGLVEPATVATFLGLAALLVPLARLCIQSVRALGLDRPERTLIVGSGPVARTVSKKLRSHRGYGLELVGYVADEDDDVEGFSHLGRCGELAQTCETLEIDRVLIAGPTATDEEMLELVRSVRNPRVQVSMVPRFFEIFPAHARLDDLEGVPVITIPPVRLGSAARIAKRAVDILVSGALLLLLAPALGAIAAAIKIDSPGPAFFHQLRRGRNGSTFRIVKFRTMIVGAEAQRDSLASRNQVDGPLFKLKDGDPRVTRIGAVLRRTSLDELPQLWNVLRGEMSLVGPRPFVVHEADQITGWASRRLDVAPGITGLWQCMGRNDLSYEEMKRLDYLYVTSWSPWWDVKIIARTVRVVLRRDGAY